ncbi:MAG: type II toxin-antitoxin system mRNA interferase toxin, RelE/StbE family [Nitrospirota bacterium]
MYKLAIKESLDKKFKKLQKKDKEMLRLIDRKVQDILVDPYRFKPLRKPMENKRRVHVGGSFVLVYEINEKKKLVTLLDFDHHDNVYET